MESSETVEGNSAGVKRRAWLRDSRRVGRSARIVPTVARAPTLLMEILDVRETGMASNPYDAIREGMDVLDLAGDKIGTIQGIHGERPDVTMPDDSDPVGRNMEAKRAGLGNAGHVEVGYKGRILFIPFHAVNEVRGDAVVLVVDREAVDQQGWDRAPTTMS
jgi:hypothetical protein